MPDEQNSDQPPAKNSNQARYELPIWFTLMTSIFRRMTNWFIDRNNSNSGQLTLKQRPIINIQFGMFFHLRFFRPDGTTTHKPHRVAQALSGHT
ncbi:hypothetical protein [Burkholderia aenigmatica]|uniref:hypothetical protein n=1 Tax=Burkholderia aenigmatica TaxID=2015348 RepID=UPI00158163A7|nr:hypothetical protein [Burkholderia aenigmatica]